MAASIEHALGVKAQLQRGASGVFDVHVDDVLIFSKFMEGNFPEEQSIIVKIQKMLQ